MIEKGNHMGEGKRRSLYIEPIVFGDMQVRFCLGLADRLGVEVSLGQTRRFYSFEMFSDFLNKVLVASDKAHKIDREIQRDREDDARFSNHS